LFLATAFRHGWTRSTSDLPNYYAAAKALADRSGALRDFYDWTWFERAMSRAGIANLPSSHGFGIWG